MKALEMFARLQHKVHTENAKHDEMYELKFKKNASMSDRSHNIINFINFIKFLWKNIFTLF